jgi:hypothetical protein
MKPSLLLMSLAALAAYLPDSHAADAVFSQDGSRIYLVDRQQAPGQLYSIEVASKEMLPAGVPDAGGEPIVSVDRSNSGFILCLTPSALLAWNVEKGSTARVCGVPKGGVFVEHAYDPKSGLIAFVVRFEKTEDGGGMDWQLWALPKGKDAPVETRVRRVESIEGMAFDSNGDLYFGADGDLWHGRIWDIDATENPGGSLQAYRCAPLATRETDNATASQIGVRAVIVLGDRIYTHVQRMGGSGWGNVARLAKPKIEKTPEGDAAFPFTLTERVAAYQRALASVEDLGENGSLAYLAASPDGKLVYYQAAPEGSELGHWLVRDHGKPEPMAVQKTP